MSAGGLWVICGWYGCLRRCGVWGADSCELGEPVRVVAVSQISFEVRSELHQLVFVPFIV